MPWRGTVAGGQEKFDREVGLRRAIKAKGAEQAAKDSSTKPPATG